MTTYLDPDFDAADSSLSPTAKAIAVSLQRYGMYVDRNEA